MTAQLALVQALLPRLTDGGRILAITSDAAREAYPGWGAYGATKAALEQLMNVLTAEHPTLRIHRVDPGDLRTQMHQDAFPGEDISDRPEPDVAVPGLLRLLEEDLPSGRWPAQELNLATWMLDEQRHAAQHVRRSGKTRRGGARLRTAAGAGSRRATATPRRRAAAGGTPQGRPLVATWFNRLPAFLTPGDLLVVNVSATLPAALGAQRADGREVMVHLSTPVPGVEDALPAQWLVEARRRQGHGSLPEADVVAGEVLTLPGLAEATLVRAWGEGPAGRLWGRSCACRRRAALPRPSRSTHPLPLCGCRVAATAGRSSATRISPCRDVLCGAGGRRPRRSRGCGKNAMTRRL